MNQSISDTFFNITFTSSGQVVNKANTTKSTNKTTITPNIPTQSQDKQVLTVPECFKVSFDDSAFFNGSFSDVKSQKTEENSREIKEIISPGDPGGTRGCLIEETTTQNKENSTPSTRQHQVSITPKKSLNSTNKHTKLNKNLTQTLIKPHEDTLNNLKTNSIENNTPKLKRLKISDSTPKNLKQNIQTPKNSPKFASTPNNTPKKLLKSDKTLYNQKYEFSDEENLKLSSLGLPREILQKYEYRGVTQMFPWQLECLSCEGVLENNKNLIYSAPTSAGKTLVAEILAIKTVLERRKKVLFILPFVSVVREKMFYFQDIFGSSGIRVEGFMGSYNPPGGFRNVNVAICTIEKANSLLNRLLEEERLSEIGAVIVDELHLIGDSSRGYLLELMLTKLTYISERSSDVRVQIVGMSATLPNLSLLGKWLSAALYVTSFRPIPLDEQCLINGEVFNSSLGFTRKLEVIPELDTDTDNVLQLCLETLLQGCSVLIFCPTKVWCENLAVQIAQAFFRLGSSQTELGLRLRGQLKVDPIKECLEHLKRSPSGLDDVLQKTVSFGVAFHHAGVTMDERDIIEGCFRTGGLKVLVATSTLSSGVNLPARRVIIRTPMFFGKPIDVLSYKQMVGRAGRMGKDTSGESILICQRKDLSVVKGLISGELEAIRSCLEESGRLKRALLEVIASGVVRTPDEVESFGRCTLLSCEGGQSEGSPISESLDFLIECQFVRLSVSTCSGDSQNCYIATSLGKACLNSSMSPEEGLTLFAELDKARQCFVLETELHLIYLVTPYSAQIMTIDWMQFLELWEKLPASMKRVGELVGIKVSFIINCTRGKVPNNNQKLAVHRRFYTALALQDLVNEVPLNEVSQKYGCNRGALQGLQQNAATFAGRVTAFSKQLGWSSVELLIGQFQDRLQFGVSRELLDLMRLPILNGQIARILFNGGVESLVDLAGSSLIELETILHKAKPFEGKDREGESKQDKERRCLRTIFISGKTGLNEAEAAKLMVQDARRYLKYEIGLSDAQWSQNSGTTESQKVHFEVSEVPDSEKRIEVPEIIEKSLESSANLGNRTFNIQKVDICSDEEGKSLNSFEISASPTAVRIIQKPDDDFNLTSLRLSSSSLDSPKSSNVNFNKTLIISPQESPDGKLTSLKKSDMSSESLFNDSLNAQMVLLPDVQGTIPETNSLNLSEAERRRLSQEKQLPEALGSDELISDEFMNSFNGSLSLQTDHGQKALESFKKLSENKNSRKRLSDTSSNSTVLSEDDIFSSQADLLPKMSHLSESFLNNSKNLDNSIEKSIDYSIEIINVCDHHQLYRAFLSELEQHDIISLSLDSEEFTEEKQLIGLRRSTKPKTKFTHKSIKLIGLGIYWFGETKTTYYVNLEKLDLLGGDGINQLEVILKKTLRIFNGKETLKMLHFCLGWSIGNLKIEDPRIADWLLDPETPEQSLQKMVRQYSSYSVGYLKLFDEQSGKTMSCLGAFLTWGLVDDVRNRLQSEDSQFLGCYENEMKIILILTKMEIHGMPIDLKTLQSYADTLKSYITSLEAEAFNIAGRRFSFTSSAAVSKVLNLRKPENRTRKSSTNKASLIQYQHPLAGLIIQWRKINLTLTKMIYPLLRNVENSRIHGTCISHNSTGRISMHEPNLQNVPRNFEFLDPVTKKPEEISIRSAFSINSCQQKVVLISADYCQLELRLLAHLSEDSTLSRIMRSDCDIFKAIAAKWMKIGENEVDDTLRQQTKQVCYGIIYGIGTKSLADQMNITENEALEFTESFHQKYPGIRVFVRKTVDKCAEVGFVETLLGRRRYLPMINSGNSTEKSKAERQAVNTTVQGSAADIAKQAMILVDEKVCEKFRNSRNVPKLILQLHDELLYEVPVKYEDVFARILKKCMQDAVKLSVPLPVKVQWGKSWGSLVFK